MIILCHKNNASDSLRIEKRKFFAIKSNTAILLFHGFSLQAEYIANRRMGVWLEGSKHVEVQSMFDVPVREINYLGGVNYYRGFSKHDTVITHNGPYYGIYCKYKQGYYGKDKTSDYKMFFAGVQAGIQTVFTRNIIFNMGLGIGVGHLIQRKELQYITFYDQFNFPLMDFRANILIGYRF